MIVESCQLYNPIVTLCQVLKKITEVILRKPLETMFILLMKSVVENSIRNKKFVKNQVECFYFLRYMQYTKSHREVVIVI